MTNYHNGPQRPYAYVLMAPGTHQTAPQTLKNYKHIIEITNTVRDIDQNANPNTKY